MLQKSKDFQNYELDLGVFFNNAKGKHRNTLFFTCADFIFRLSCRVEMFFAGIVAPKCESSSSMNAENVKQTQEVVLVLVVAFLKFCFN